MNLKARLPAIVSFLIFLIATFTVGFACGYKQGYTAGSAGQKSALASQLINLFSRGETHVRTNHND